MICSVFDFFHQSYAIHTNFGDGLRTSSLESLPNWSCASAHPGRAHISPKPNPHALDLDATH